MVHGLSELLGKHLLFTMLVCDRTGAVSKRRQMHGIVEDRGDDQPTLHLQDSDERIPLPPLYDQYEQADPAKTYTLEASGERISGLDYTLTCVKSQH